MVRTEISVIAVWRSLPILSSQSKLTIYGQSDKEVLSDCKIVVLFYDHAVLENELDQAYDASESSVTENTSIAKYPSTPNLLKFHTKKSTSQVCISRWICSFQVWFSVSYHKVRVSSNFTFLSDIAYYERIDQPKFNWLTFQSIHK